MSTPSLVFLDGRELRHDTSLRCDVVVIGSGPGGATVADHLASVGADVIVVEAGPWVPPDDLPADPLRSLTQLYAGGGFAFTHGPSPMQVLYGRVLGGTSVVNSAICWRLPRRVYDEWITNDVELADALRFEDLDRAGAEMEARLGVTATDPLFAGGNNAVMARGAERLGWAHQPIRRNTNGCQGLARCNAGCPKGAKLSMDRSLLPDAVRHGARVITSVEVRDIIHDRQGASGITAATSGGGVVRINASHAVVVAAGAIGTPLLLVASQIDHGPVGRRLQCHPGIAVAGRFTEDVRSWHGATQGHEITELMDDGIKLESLAFDPSLLVGRVNRLGTRLVEELDRLSTWATWAGAVRARAFGSVQSGRRGPTIRYELLPGDVRRLKRTVAALGQVMFAAGAVEVVPGVAGFEGHVTDPDVMHRFAADGPDEPAAYTLALSHLFGTCRLGTRPSVSVVGPDFRHHTVDRLYVADASVFPTNLGVNPQISIMAMAQCCARGIASRSSAWKRRVPLVA